MATVPMTKPAGSSHMLRTRQLRMQPFLCMPLGRVPSLQNRYQEGLLHGSSVPFGEAFPAVAYGSLADQFHARAGPTHLQHAVLLGIFLSAL